MKVVKTSELQKTAEVLYKTKIKKLEKAQRNLEQELLEIKREVANLKRPGTTFVEVGNDDTRLD